MSAAIVLNLVPTYSVSLALVGDEGTLTIGSADDSIDVELVAALRGPAGSGNNADCITPVGTVDGANAVFTLTQAPSPAASLQLFRNGVLQRPDGVDYTLASSTITYITAPSVGDTHVAWYRY